MKYQSGFKYQLKAKEIFFDTNITPAEIIQTKYITLTSKGRVNIPR